MNETVVRVFLETELLEEIEQTIENETVTRSEIFGRAAKMYLKSEKEWDRIFACGNRMGIKYGITEEVIAEEIRLYREEQNAKNE